MLSQLDRYLLSKLTLAFLIAISGFLIFVLLLSLGQLTPLLQNQSISLGIIAQLLLGQIPHLLMYAFPSAVALSIFLTLTNLGSHNELTAIESAGISPHRVMVPVLIFALAVSLFGVVVSDKFLPGGNLFTRQLFFEAINSDENEITIRPKSLISLGPDQLFYIGSQNKETGEFHDVLVHDLSGSFTTEDCGTLPVVLFGKTARWADFQWVLFDGYIHCYDTAGRLVSQANFSSFAVDVYVTPADFSLRQRTTYEMSLGEIRSAIAAYKRTNSDSTQLEIEYNLRIGLPMSALVLALMAFPLAFSFGRRGIALGIIAGVVLFLLHNGSIFLSVFLFANREILSPFMGVWLPNVLFALLGVVLILCINKLHSSRFAK